jgi:hypothetical protein
MQPEDLIMKTRSRPLLIAAALLLAASISPLAATSDSDRVAYPEGYRAWTHVKSMLIQPDHPLADPFAGIHHIYANAGAMAGYRSGSFPDGAVIVFDLLEYDEGDGAIVEGNRKFIGVMAKDSRRFSATGGWGYEAFAADSRTDRLVGDGGQSCHGCHQAQKGQDYVFSTWRE